MISTSDSLVKNSHIILDFNSNRETKASWCKIQQIWGRSKSFIFDVTQETKEAYS